jgi:hypothetical protein
VAERLFTLTEATALLGPLRRCIDDLHESIAALREESVRLAPVLEDTDASVGGPDLRQYARAQLTVARCLRQIDHWGVILRDVEAGLCDFPATRDGRLVYLCWRVREPRIGHWHEVGEGYGGRQTLDDYWDPGPL